MSVTTTKITHYKMNEKLRGTICGIAAAVCYGTNPLGAINLYASGITASSTLFYRFGLACLTLAIIMIAQRKSFAVTRRELGILALLGVLMGSSSSTLYFSFLFMDVGIASTLLFVYPVMVAVIMAVMFKERVGKSTIAAICLALAGIALLNRTSDGSALSAWGVTLVMISSLTYAVYIVVVNKSSLRMSSIKLTFYVLLFGVTAILGFTLAMGEHVQLLTTTAQWAFALQLAWLPTVMSLVLMVIAVHDIGSTPTAIMGAIEPITAVAIGVVCFGEDFTPRLALGIVLILSAVILIIAGKEMSPHKITMVIGKIGKRLVKSWRWKQ